MLPCTPHHRRPQRRPHRLAAILALTALFALTACGPRDTNPPPPPTPSSTDAPPFASDEEALAAAEAVYREYLQVISNIPDFTHLRRLGTSEIVAREEATYRKLASEGFSGRGESQVVSFSLQQYSNAELSAYACVDVSAVRILDATGVDVTPPDRPDRSTLLVSFVFDNGKPFLSRSELWSSSCS